MSPHLTRVIMLAGIVRTGATLLNLGFLNVASIAGLNDTKDGSNSPEIFLLTCPYNVDLLLL